jgi:serine/threonine protein kinase
VAHVHDCGIVHRDLKRASRESNVGGGTREILFTCFFCYL